MSVCIVAKYPWKAIEAVANAKTVQPGGIGAIVFSDTRVVTLPKLKAINILAAKQRLISKHIFVCYTSSNFLVTTTAVTHSMSPKVSLKRLGENLSKHHTRYGGLTELLAVVRSRSGSLIEVLELMPDSYVPRQRSGIIEIGDDAVLTEFRQQLAERAVEFPTPKDIVSSEFKAGFEKFVGRPARFKNPFPISRAALEVGMALGKAIEQAQSPTVALPITVTLITPEGMQPLEYASVDTANVVSHITTEGKPLMVPSDVPVRTPRWTGGDRSAIQLIE